VLYKGQALLECSDQDTTLWVGFFSELPRKCLYVCLEHRNVSLFFNRVKCAPDLVECLGLVAAFLCEDCGHFRGQNWHQRSQEIVKWNPRIFIFVEHAEVELCALHHLIDVSKLELAAFLQNRRELFQSDLACKRTIFFFRSLIEEFLDLKQDLGHPGFLPIAFSIWCHKK